MSPTADDDLFVYGSLLFPEVLLALLDRLPSRMPAAAPGWRAAALPERVYPGLVPSEGSASGLLIAGLDAGEWDTLIAFEGDLYEVRRLTLSGGVAGWAFVWGGSGPVSPLDWVPEEFADRELPSYLEGCRAWRRRYEAARADLRPAGR